MMYKSIIADKETWNLPIKTVDGKQLILVGTKTSRRTLRKGKKEYYYNLEGTNRIYYNQSKNGVWYSPVALYSYTMKKYYDLYCVSPLTRSEREYLTLHPNIEIMR